MKTQVSINPDDFCVFEKLAIDYEIETAPRIGESMVLGSEVTNHIRNKIFELEPSKVKTALIELVFDLDKNPFLDSVYEVKNIVHYPSKIIYEISAGDFWLNNLLNVEKNLQT
mgnify:CR=1 FL=1